MDASSNLWPTLSSMSRALKHHAFETVRYVARLRATLDVILHVLLHPSNDIRLPLPLTNKVRVVA